jgi:hypothetical protein
MDYETKLRIARKLIDAIDESFKSNDIYVRAKLIDRYNRILRTIRYNDRIALYEQGRALQQQRINHEPKSIAYI